MCKVDELQNSVDHGVAERDQCVDATQANAVDDVLDELLAEVWQQPSLIERVKARIDKCRGSKA